MIIALEEAKQGIDYHHGGPFGAVVVDKDGIVIGKGHNKVLLNKDPTCHGEIEAIRDACKNINSYDLSGCTLYTTSEPCPMCKCAIQWANISKIYYGCTVDDAEKLGFRDKKFLKTDLETHQDGLFDCKELFKEYLKKNPVIY